MGAYGSVMGHVNHASDRNRMVDAQIQNPYDSRPPVVDDAVLRAMRKVPRHLFVPEEHQNFAYEDRPLPIGHGQTISQPYIVAIMTELLQLEPEHRVLEIGTGSGYQAAVLAEIAGAVYSVEIVEPLAILARERLAALDYRNVTVRAGNGYLGWPEHAPFDAVIATAAPKDVPQALIDQLKLGGRMVLPVGPAWRTQMLKLVQRHHDGSVTRDDIMAVGFVPMIRNKR
jgi:protein-L-isoaspartate(D-aspartate) O-methyltransferase